jgi:hypothetical protein
MKISKDLTNIAGFEPLVYIELNKDQAVDLHNNFVFTGMAFHNITNRLTIVFESDTGLEKVFLQLGKVTAIEINFRFVETGDESISLDMLSKGEEINKPVDSTDQYFFLDFTNGMHIDCNCESCIIEYEDKKVIRL